MTEVREGNTAIRHVTWAELRREAGRLAAALKARGLKKGDRVVMVGGHSLTTLTVLLATVWLGGIFSSSSTDMGVGGLLQRTVQINPKVRELYPPILNNSEEDETSEWFEAALTSCASLSSLTMGLYIMAKPSI